MSGHDIGAPPGARQGAATTAAPHTEERTADRQDADSRLIVGQPADSATGRAGLEGLAGIQIRAQCPAGREFGDLRHEPGSGEQIAPSVVDDLGADLRELVTVYGMTDAQAARVVAARWGLAELPPIVARALRLHEPCEDNYTDPRWDTRLRWGW